MQRNGTNSSRSTTTAERPDAVALYCRVSTEDQAERQTIQGQLDFLRKYCDLHGLTIAGEYIDDGISGTVAMSERPEGRRLLDDAEARRFSVVLVYRLDRLGRSLKALLAAHDALDALGIAIRSGTEPFDTATPIGKFVFNLLGSMAELERSTITERLVMGRDRVARGGKYTGGPIPFGYDVEDGLLVPSTRRIEAATMTEAELVGDLFARVAAGATLYAEAERLTALGVARVKRYPGGKEKREADAWTAPRLAYVLHNPAYKGEGRLNSRNGALVRPAPALTDAQTWDTAQTALRRNRTQSRKNAKRLYLLRLLIRCGNCGMGYTGATWRDPKGRKADWPHYSCNGRLRSLHGRDGARCYGRDLDAPWLEDLVWNRCAAYIRTPGDYLARAQARLRERLAQSTDAEAQRRALLGQIAEKESERERVLSMYRRGRISMDEADRELEAVAQETATLRQLVESLRAQEALTAAAEAHLTETAAALTRLQAEVDAIEAMPAGPERDARMREIFELLVYRITIHTEPGERGKRKPARVEFEYAYGEAQTETVVSRTETRG